MKNEKLAMRKEKRGIGKILLCYLLAALCYLILGCQDPFLTPEPENPRGDPPAGKGFFYLSVTTTDSARTILPDTPVESDFAMYELIFTPTGTPVTGTAKTEDITPTNSTTTISLDPGTYTLVVKAYLGPGKTRLAAQGSSATNITITAGQSTDGSVILKAIISEGQGNFAYNVTIPAGLSTATMDVYQQNTLVPVITTVNLTSGSNIGTPTLNTGYYDVVFNLVKANGDTMVWRELLHIYANLESKFTHTFNDNDFYKTRYTVTFNANGGTVTPTTQTVQHGGTVSLPTPAGKTGHTFDTKWYYDDNMTTAFSASTPITSDITLYAGWAVNSYDVTFNADGGIPAPTSPQSIAYGSLVPEPGTMTKTGHTFGGWYSTSNFADGTQWNFATGTVPANNITLYAKWTPIKYTVTFVANDGTPAPGTQSIDYGGLVTQPLAMTRAGYTFGGWYSTSTFTDGTQWNFATGTVPVDGITLYARWMANSAVITITIEQIKDIPDINGGTISISGKAPNLKTVTLTLAAGAYTDIEWSIAGVGVGATITGSENTFIVDAENENYNSIGGHPVTLNLKIGGVPYRKIILVEIVE
jgi:uncharacterized repeat protein (TIGR02543 family)